MLSPAGKEFQSLTAASSPSSRILSFDLSRARQSEALLLNTRNYHHPQMLQDLILCARLCDTGLITHPSWLIYFHQINMDRVCWQRLPTSSASFELECPSECVKQWIIRTHFLNVGLQERIRAVMCAGDFNYVYVFGFGILNQTIWSLVWFDILKQFEKLIKFSLWGPCTVMADFESICVGRVCQESEDLSVPLSMSCLCVDVLYLIVERFCHVVVRSLFHVLIMSKVAVKLLVEKCFVPMSSVALCSGC